MFTLDTTDTQRITVSAIGALIVSAACVLSAVGPARFTAAASSATYAQAATGASAPA